MTPILVPELGADAVLSVWYVRPGEAVYGGNRVAEVLLPGITVDVLAPADGVLHQRIALCGDVVRSGDAIGTVRPEG